MSCHLTQRFWTFGAGGLGCLLFGVLLQSPGAVALSIPFWTVVLLSVIDGWWPSAWVTGTELSTERVIEGDFFEYTVEVEAQGRVPWVEVEFQATGGIESAGPTRFVQPMSGSQKFSARFKANHWGVRGPEYVFVTCRDRLGITQTHLKVPIGERVRVHPPTETLSSLVPLDNPRQMTGDHRSRNRGGGTEVAEVRPYRPGDPVRSVSPRMSARRGQPMVVERHPDQASDIVIYVDSIQDVGVGLGTSLRWTVTAAMALAERHLRSMDRVGILDRGAGVRWLDASMGRKAQHKIVDALLRTAVLNNREGDAHSVPIDRLPKGAVVFAISPLLSAVSRADLVMLRRRGHQVVVVRPEALDGLIQQLHPMAARIMAISTEVRRRQMADYGVVVIAWDPREPLDNILEQAAVQVIRNRAALKPASMAGAAS